MYEKRNDDINIKNRDEKINKLLKNDKTDKTMDRQLLNSNVKPDLENLYNKLYANNGE